MLVYKCKQCGQLTTGGLINEFGEHFCREACYEIYCGIHGYEVHKENLKENATQA